MDSELTVSGRRVDVGEQGERELPGGPVLLRQRVADSQHDRTGRLDRRVSFTEQPQPRVSVGAAPGVVEHEHNRVPMQVRRQPDQPQVLIVELEVGRRFEVGETDFG